MLEGNDQVLDPENENEGVEEEGLGQGCIEGMRCPECDNTDRFQIGGTSFFDVVRNGTDEFGDVEWDDASTCVCPECQYVGDVLDFKPEEKASLVALLEDLNQNGIQGLSELVAGVYAKKAAEVTSEGLEAQVRFLIHALGKAPFRKQVRLPSADG